MKKSQWMEIELDKVVNMANDVILEIQNEILEEVDIYKYLCIHIDSS